MAERPAWRLEWGVIVSIMCLGAILVRLGKPGRDLCCTETGHIAGALAAAPNHRLQRASYAASADPTHGLLLLCAAAAAAAAAASHSSLVPLQGLYPSMRSRNAGSLSLRASALPSGDIAPADGVSAAKGAAEYHAVAERPRPPPLRNLRQRRWQPWRPRNRPRSRQPSLQTTRTLQVGQQQQQVKRLAPLRQQQQELHPAAEKRRGGGSPAGTRFLKSAGSTRTCTQRWVLAADLIRGAAKRALHVAALPCQCSAWPSPGRA